MLALHEATLNGALEADIVGVLSDRAGAKGLTAARERGLRAVDVEAEGRSGRTAREAALEDHLRALEPDIICLAGYLRILTGEFLQRWPRKVVNIHPSLLPSFPGLDTHRRALDAGVAIHGCTVHGVTAGVDEGPIIAQSAVPVLPGDDESTLSNRVLSAEHELYAAAISDLLAGNVRWEQDGMRRLSGRGWHRIGRAGAARRPIG